MQERSPRATPEQVGSIAVRAVVDRDRIASLLRREPVNPVDDAADPVVFDAAVRDRSDVDRRVFELVDPARPDHPRTVVWVALTDGVPSTLDELTDDRAPLPPTSADTAVFWSIWNIDPHASGPPGGRELIEGAVTLLRQELDGLRTFVTLSPIPGLRRWIEDAPDPVDTTNGTSLARAAARYLTSLDDAGRPLDGVARFHLGNGARLWRINLDADRSHRGVDRSFGVMANYRYEPEDRRANRELLRSGTVATSPEVASLAEATRIARH